MSTSNPRALEIDKDCVALRITKDLERATESVKVDELKAKAQSLGVSAQQFVEQAINRALEEDSRSVWDIFAESRKRIPTEEFAKLPGDGSDEHDHYLYGQPKRNQ